MKSLMLQQTEIVCLYASLLDWVLHASLLDLAVQYAASVIRVHQQIVDFMCQHDFVRYFALLLYLSSENS
jgi:hypothetical protein